MKLLELFGGVGAPRVALKNLGIEVKSIDYIEIDCNAVKSYNEIFKEDLPYKSQNVIGYNLKPDILVHGSPCQDFSIAGRQNGGDKGSETRSSLMWETINIVNQMGCWKPKIVIWENVKNVLSKSMIANFKRYLKEMEALGYTNSYRVLNAIDFGLPQSRERVFTISILGKDKHFNFDNLEKKTIEPLYTFLEDSEDIQYIVKQPSILKGIGGKGINRATVITDTAYTITTRQMRSPAQIIELGEERYRFLTERECWRLQGYSDKEFEAALKANPGTKNKMNTALYKQAGNSIPIPVLESIFKELLDVV